MSVLPNLFESVIAKALARPGATTESVAAAIASSHPFLKAVRLDCPKRRRRAGAQSR